MKILMPRVGLLFGILLNAFFAPLTLHAAAHRFVNHGLPSKGVSSYIVHPNNDREAADLAYRFDVEGKRNGGFVVYVTPATVKDLLSTFPQAKLFEKDISAAEEVQKNFDLKAASFDFTKMEARIKELATSRPDLFNLQIYGKSSAGRNLYALKASDNAGTEENEPNLMITGATHGNEVLTVDVVMGLINEIAVKHDTDSRVKALVTGRAVYFIPVVSPDSYVARSRYVDGVDPNRDYPYPGDQAHSSVRVIKAISDLSLAKKFKGSLDYHSVASVIMYPWAYTNAAPEKALETEFKQLVGKMAQTNGYQTGQISKVMYIAQGSSADFYLWKSGTRAVATELSQGKAETTQQLKNVITENIEPSWRFIEHFAAKK